MLLPLSPPLPFSGPLFRQEPLLGALCITVVAPSATCIGTFLLALTWGPGVPSQQTAVCHLSLSCAFHKSGRILQRFHGKDNLRLSFLHPLFLVPLISGRRSTYLGVGEWPPRCLLPYGHILRSLPCWLLSLLASVDRNDVMDPLI